MSRFNETLDLCESLDVSPRAKNLFFNNVVLKESIGGDALNAIKAAKGNPIKSVINFINAGTPTIQESTETIKQAISLLTDFLQRNPNGDEEEPHADGTRSSRKEKDIAYLQTYVQKIDKATQDIIKAQQEAEAAEKANQKIAQGVENGKQESKELVDNCNALKAEAEKVLETYEKDQNLEVLKSYKEKTFDPFITELSKNEVNAEIASEFDDIKEQFDEVLNNPDESSENNEENAENTETEENAQGEEGSTEENGETQDSTESDEKSEGDDKNEPSEEKDAESESDDQKSQEEPTKDTDKKDEKAEDKKDEEPKQE